MAFAEKGISIRGSEYLREDQAFYDQPPFADVIISHASAAIPSVVIQVAITKIVREPTFFNGIDNPENVPARVRQNVSSILHPTFNVAHTIDPQLPTVKLPKDEFIKTMTVIFEQLNAYPYWMEYVQKNLYSYEYNQDGKRRVPFYPGATFETYVGWLPKRVEQDNRYYDLDEVLADTFPDNGFSSLADIKDAVNRTGRRKNNREYCIRRKVFNSNEQ